MVIEFEFETILPFSPFIVSAQTQKYFQLRFTKNNIEL